MRRRDFLAMAGAVVAAPRTAVAQQQRLPRVALASSTVPLSDMRETGSNASWRASFAEFRRLGLVEGQNVLFERYSTLGVTESRQLGRAIASTRPDLIFVGGSTDIASEAARTDPNIPVVFAVGDALASGLVSNLARPGGNLTGANTTAGVETEGKRIELLREAVPHARRAGFLDTLAGYEPLGRRPVVEAAASRLGLTLIPAIVDRPYDEAVFKAAFSDLARQGAQMLNLGAATPLTTNASIIVSHARAARLPACGFNSAFVEAGALMSYGADQAVAWQRAAAYVVQILNGARAGDLPVQQPEKFELVINLKAAVELGLEIPQSLLLQATDVRS
jgi:putative ABC transport system substrate-binding protein